MDSPLPCGIFSGPLGFNSSHCFMNSFEQLSLKVYVRRLVQSLRSAEGRKACQGRRSSGQMSGGDMSVVGSTHGRWPFMGARPCLLRASNPS